MEKAVRQSNGHAKLTIRLKTQLKKVVKDVQIRWWSTHGLIERAVYFIGDQIAREIGRHRSPALIDRMVRPEIDADSLRPAHIRPEEAEVQQDDWIKSPVVPLIWDLYTSLKDVLDGLREHTPDEDEADVACSR